MLQFFINNKYLLSGLLLLTMQASVSICSQEENYVDDLMTVARGGNLAEVQRIPPAHPHTITSKLDVSNMAPLCIVDGAGQLPVAELLVWHTADVNVRDINGKRLLHVAARHDDLDMVELLLARGAKVNVRDVNGRTPLHLAAVHGHLAVAEYLVSHGADVNAQDKYDYTLFHRAAQNGDLAYAEFLVKHGANVNAQNEEGRTPLHWAAGFGHLAVVRLLVEKGADVNARGYIGWTPLHLAVEAGHANVAEELVKRYANIDNTLAEAIRSLTGNLLQERRERLVALLDDPEFGLPTDLRDMIIAFVTEI